MRAGKSSPRNEQALQFANQSGGIVTVQYFKSRRMLRKRGGPIVGEVDLRFDTDPPYLIQTLRQLETVLRSFLSKQAQ